MFLCRLIGRMPIECEFCNGKVERCSREEHAALCEMRPLKCAALDCEFQSADRVAFANHIASVHREQLIRKYARLFRKGSHEGDIRPRVAETTAPPRPPLTQISTGTARRTQRAASIEALTRALERMEELRVENAEAVHEYALRIICNALSTC